MRSKTKDLDMKAEVSKILYEASRKTWANRKGNIGEVIEPFSDFSGLRACSVAGLPEDICMGAGSDGIGTKVLIAQRMQRHDTIPHDLMAMDADDAVVRGAEPVWMSSVLDVNSLDERHLKYIRQLARGLVDAARDANVAVINGETAELGSPCVGGYGTFNYNWGATVIWFARRSRMFTGKEIRPGDAVVALREEGFRSNGITKVRSIMEKAYGPEWHEHPTGNGIVIGEKLLRPSRVYSGAVIKMIGGVKTGPRTEVHGVAHVTGGGIPEKLGRVLRPSGLAAMLYDLFSPCDLMLECQRLGSVRDREAYSRWNMGQGMLVITPKPDEVIAIAKTSGIEAKVAGEITRYKGVSLLSKGYYSTSILRYR